METLKLKTSCNNCHKQGHWSKWCPYWKTFQDDNKFVQNRVHVPMMSDSIVSIRMKFFMMIKKIHKWRDLVMFVFVNGDFQSTRSQQVKDYKPSVFYHVDICSPIWFVPSLGRSRYIFALQRWLQFLSNCLLHQG
jgi:hypothetical protein